MDVILLGKSAVKLFNMMESQNGCSPVDTGRNTLSSYSMDAMHKHLMHNKRLGIWSPTNPLLYAGCKAASIGGLACVFRHQAGSDELIKDDWPPHPNQSEGSPPKRARAVNPEANVLYADYSALYGSWQVPRHGGGGQGGRE